jgi:hypothetical protein
MKRILTEQQVASAKQVVRHMRLKPEDVYSQMKNKAGRTIGTSYDVRITLEFGFTEFEKLVDNYMQAVWNTSIRDGYTFETDD